MSAEAIVIVGAGAAGLSAAWHARQRGLEPLIVERQEAAGGAWRRMRPRMRCLSHRRFDRLPDGSYPLGPGDRATAREVASWLGMFADRSRFRTQYGVTVQSVSRRAGCLRVTTDQGEVDTRRLIVASGEHGNPWVPAFARALDVPSEHSSTLAEDGVSEGQRVLVVGAGNSGAEVTRLLLGRGAHVVLAVGRRQVVHMAPPRGLRAEVGYRVSSLPVRFFPGRLGCTDQTPLVDSVFHDALRDGRVTRVPKVVRVDHGRPVFEDGVVRHIDRVVWATGFVRETSMLSPVVRVGPRGHVEQRAGLVTADIGVLGIPCMRTRRSGFLRGFAGDALRVVRGLA